MLSCEQLPARDLPGVLVVQGSDLLALTDSGEIARAYRDVVEPSASNVPFQVAVSPDGRSAVLGAGAGGGPRIIRVDLDAGRVVDSRFVGPPGDRGGVGVAWLSVIPAPASLFHAQPSPTDPGETAFVDQIVPRLPVGEQKFLVAHGSRLLVYAGTVVTDDPKWAALKGVETGAAGDGGRTYDHVAALADFGENAAWVPEHIGVDVTFHELGHLTEPFLSASDKAAWLAIQSTTLFGDPYQQLNETEAWAESVRRWGEGTGQPDPRINPLLESVFVG